MNTDIKKFRTDFQPLVPNSKAFIKLFDKLEALDNENLNVFILKILNETKQIVDKNYKNVPSRYKDVTAQASLDKIVIMLRRKCVEYYLCKFLGEDYAGLVETWDKHFDEYDKEMKKVAPLTTYVKTNLSSIINAYCKKHLNKSDYLIHNSICY